MTQAAPVSISASAAGGAPRKHVTVVGAGLVGLASALWLQEFGHEVVVVDPSPPLGEEPWRHAASYGNACTFAPHGVVPVSIPGLAWQVPGMLLDVTGPLAINWRYLPRLAPWLRAFLRAGREAEVNRIAGTLAALLNHADAGWQPLFELASAKHLLRRKGCLYLYKTEAEYAAGEYGNRLRERHGVRLTRLDAAEVRDLEPNVAPLYHAGVLYDDAYTIHSPRQMGEAFARAFQAKGGKFVKGCATGLGSTRTRLEFSVDGVRHSTEHIVVAAGAFSGSLASQLGDRVLLDTERGYHVMFPHAAELVQRPVCFVRHGFYMTPMADGLRAAGTVEFGGLSAAPNKVRSDVIRSEVGRLLPAAGTAGKTWMGFRPSMPDSLPVIGDSPATSNVTYAFGHGHLGLTLAGVTGRLVAELVSGRPPHVDITQLRIDRFHRWGGRRKIA
ncbi:FAD-dependent oxidoreductase [Mesorhizobium sp. LHD-90]|uniref:NAD(P)/FAD-dependent oxidoreductase n=1 Tax=Mesorhizobium sp. LHD-90 TaxID=3071414 RepID=UPI0027E1EC18|nr:FAD-dependent oxidoreductase [Mesorhizobium sp. LHD-90]MDQ6433921.1 FAD-dependent oxidoreductase [Mesorhizobium sp. LHD-90]